LFGWNLRCTNGITQEMMTHSPSNVYETRTMGVTTIVKDATLVLKGLTQRHLEASCVMPIS
jgi:hypothetical protein